MSVKITQFEAENVKRIKALTLTPATNGLTVIGGRNNQGKTSSLDAIAWVLGGDRFRPSQAQREGSVVPPRVLARLDNGIVVERSGKNGSLKVTDASGQRAGQTLLNAFVEQLALDLPRFMQASGKEKAATLLRIIGLEDQVDALDRQEKELYDQRHAIGQIADQKAKCAKELPAYPEAPAEPVSAYDLIQRQQEILARNGENQRKRQKAAQLEAERDTARERLEELERRYGEAQARYAGLCVDCETAKKDALDLLDESTAELEDSIREIEAVNQKVRVNQEKARAEAEAREYGEQYAGLTAKIEDVRLQRTRLLEGADLPLPGLSVENGELLYQGRPWDCMSGSNQLKVSTAIVKSLKPDCGFVLVDGLEAMDIETLREFGEWAEQEGLQIIATRVSSDGEGCSIIISDGYSEVPQPKPTLSWEAGKF